MELLEIAVSIPTLARKPRCDGWKLETLGLLCISPYRNIFGVAKWLISGGGFRYLCIFFLMYRYDEYHSPAFWKVENLSTLSPYSDQHVSNWLWFVFRSLLKILNLALHSFPRVPCLSLLLRPSRNLYQHGMVRVLVHVLDFLVLPIVPQNPKGETLALWSSF